MSHPDLCVLALTYALSEEDKKRKLKDQAEAKKEGDEIQTEGTEPVWRIMNSIVVFILITLQTDSGRL